MAWDISALASAGKSFVPTQTDASGNMGFCLSHDMSILYVRAVTVADFTGQGGIHQYTLSTPGDITTAVYASKKFDLTDCEVSLFPTSMQISPDGTKLFVSDNDGTTFDTYIREFTLSTAYDISTASLTNTLDVSVVIGTDGSAFHFSQDGKHLYIEKPGDQTIHQWDLTTAWSTATASYTSKSFNPTATTTTTNFVRIGNDGQWLAVQANTLVWYQFSLSTAYDISTASYDSKSFNFPSAIPAIAGNVPLWNSCDSSTVFHMGGTNADTIYQFTMGAASTGCVTVSGGGGGCPGETYFSGGAVRLTTAAVTGFWWLGCTTVKALVDGNVIDLEVCNGKITFPRLAARAHIGLPYTADIETLNIETPGGSGSIQGGRKKVTDVTTRFYKSRLPLIGPNFFDMVQMKQRETEAYGEPTRLLSGDRTTNIPPEWNSHGRVAYRMKDPVPLTILAVVPELEVEDDG